MLPAYEHLINKLKLNNISSSAESRKQRFDELFKKYVLEFSAENPDPVYKTIDENGAVNFNSIIYLTDKLGSGGFNFFINGQCKSLPSKETILLLGVALCFSTEAVDELLTSAGYSNYIKNLNEFIICVGLHQKVGMDAVRKKLYQYGYREEMALDRVNYSDEFNPSKSKVFSEKFEAFCIKKNKTKKAVLEKAGLVASKLDKEKNTYYQNAFYGKKQTPITLQRTQCISLFDALELSKIERIEYINFLVQHQFIRQEYNSKHSNSSHCTSKAFNFINQPDHLSEYSVYTQYLEHYAKNISWDKLDEYICETFGYIRSFAVFYEQVLHYEGFEKIGQFCAYYNLSERSHYKYIDGLRIPTAENIIIISSLMPNMTLQIFNTLLKKAGKLEFGGQEDSFLYLIAEHIYQFKKENTSVFGTLYDFIEQVLLDQPKINIQVDELYHIYLEMSKILARTLLEQPSIKETANPSLKKLIDVYIGDNSSKLLKHSDNYVLLSQIVKKINNTFDSSSLEGLSQLFIMRYGFDQRSTLIQAITGSEKELEEA